MRSRTIGAMTALTAGAGAAAILAASSMATADHTAPATPTSGSQVVSGTVVDGNGRPVPQARVEVFSEDRSNDDVLVDEMFAHSTTDKSGGFVVVGRLRHPVKPNPDQSVPLQVQVTTDDNLTKTFGLNAIPPTRPGAKWTWGDQVDGELVPNSTEAQADAMAHHGVEGLTLDMSHAAPARG